MQASQRLAEATKRPVPASKKCGLTLERPEPVSGRPGPAFGEPHVGKDGWTDGWTDRWMDGWMYRFPLTLSPPTVAPWYRQV